MTFIRAALMAGKCPANTPTNTLAPKAKAMAEKVMIGAVSVGDTRAMS